MRFALKLAARIIKTVRPFLGKRRSSQRISLGDDLKKMRLDAEAARTLRSTLEISGTSSVMLCIMYYTITSDSEMRRSRHSPAVSEFAHRRGY